MDGVHQCRKACGLLLFPLFLILAGCSGDPFISGTRNGLVITPSTTDPVTTAVGGTRTFSLTFNSSDGRPLTALTLTDNLTALPAGWTGPATFTCATVTTGSGCVLSLTYAPMAFTPATTLTLNLTYYNNAGVAQSGAQTVTYSASSHNNVVSAASPVGQINAIVGTGKQTVTATFTTDDGNAAMALMVTSNLSALPAGWTSTQPAFACATVSNGSGCQLSLSYNPTAAGSGTLTLAFAYEDNSGTAKRGTLNIPYAATTHNNVIGTTAPTGQINAIVGTGNQSVTVTFNTDDGNPATNLTVTSDLTALPAGWRSTSTTFTCASVSTGNGCQLPLSYNPPAIASGTLILTYTYRDDSGTVETGTLNIPYAATTHNNVVGTPSQSGQINAIAGGVQPLVVTFTTDDGNPATALTVQNDLTALAAGWTSASTTLTCATVSTGNGCQLSLTFAPTGVSSGTLILNYTYQDDSGTTKTAAVDIPYASTVSNNANVTVSPSTVAGRTQYNQPVTVTFTTDDGNVATNLVVNAQALATLPAGWSSPSGPFTCATFSVGSGCQLALTFTSTATVAASTLSLGFTYTNNAGVQQSGTASINYSATISTLGVANYNSEAVSSCPLNNDGTLGACQSILNPVKPGPLYDFEMITGLWLTASWPRVEFSGDPFWTCGPTVGCGAYGGQTYVQPTNLTVNPAGTWAYVYDVVGGMLQCTIGDSAFYAISSCAPIAVPTGLQGVTFAADGSHIYAAYANSSTRGIYQCVANSDGSLSGCVQTGTNTGNIKQVTQILLDRLYALDVVGGIDVCPINSDGTLGACQNTASTEQPYGAALTSYFAYLSTNSNTLRLCPLNSDGTLGTCTDITDSSFDGTLGVHIN